MDRSDSWVVNCRRRKTRCLPSPQMQEDQCTHCRERSIQCSFQTVDKPVPDLKKDQNTQDHRGHNGSRPQMPTGADGRASQLIIDSRSLEPPITSCANPWEMPWLLSPASASNFTNLPSHGTDLRNTSICGIDDATNSGSIQFAHASYRSKEALVSSQDYYQKHSRPTQNEYDDAFRRDPYAQFFAGHSFTSLQPSGLFAFKHCTTLVDATHHFQASHTPFLH